MYRRIKSIIDELKDSQTEELEPQILKEDCCSETETEGDDQLSNRSDISCSPEISKLSFSKSKPCPSGEDVLDDVPSISILCPTDSASKSKPRRIRKPATCREQTEISSRSNSRPTSGQAISRKRVRVILSDDESENEVPHSSGRFHISPAEDVATSDEGGSLRTLFLLIAVVEQD